MAGALQLLPTNDHVCEETPDKHWLQVTDPKFKAIAGDVVGKDIYKIYETDTLGLISCKRYDEFGNPKPYTEEEFNRITYTDIFGDQIDTYASNVKSDELRNANNIEYYYKNYNYKMTHYSSAGRAGDCNVSLEIPRSLVRVRPVRFCFFLLIRFFKTN